MYQTGEKVLDTISRSLYDLKLPKMAETLSKLYQSEDFLEMDPLSLFNDIVQSEHEYRMDKQFENRLKEAKLKGCSHEIANCIDSKERQYLPTGITNMLSSLKFIENGMNVCILGPSDSGKTYLAKAIGINACQQFHVQYFHCEDLMEELVALKTTDYKKFQNRLKSISKKDLLILDDFLLHTIGDEREIKVLFQLMESRNEQNKSTIICSQREPQSWTSMILNDEVSANSIVKRATRNYSVVIRSKSN